MVARYGPISMSWTTLRALYHDRRYSLDSSKLKALGWQPRHDFEQAIEKTVRWYVDNA
jgi:dTDP-D-glucose 4,6-dehydratase